MVNEPGEPSEAAPERFPGEGAGSAAAASPLTRKQLVQGEHRGLGMSQPPNPPAAGSSILPPPPSHPCPSWGSLPG